MLSQRREPELIAEFVFPGDASARSVSTNTSFSQDTASHRAHLHGHVDTFSVGSMSELHHHLTAGTIKAVLHALTTHMRTPVIVGISGAENTIRQQIHEAQGFCMNRFRLDPGGNEVSRERVQLALASMRPADRLILHIPDASETVNGDDIVRWTEEYERTIDVDVGDGVNYDRFSQVREVVPNLRMHCRGELLWQQLTDTQRQQSDGLFSVVANVAPEQTRGFMKSPGTTSPEHHALIARFSDSTDVRGCTRMIKAELARLGIFTHPNSVSMDS